MIHWPAKIRFTKPLEQARQLREKYDATFGELDRERQLQIHLFFIGGVEYSIIEYADESGNPATDFYTSNGAMQVWIGIEAGTLPRDFTLKQLLEYGAIANCLNDTGKAKLASLMNEESKPEATGKRQTWLKRWGIKGAKWEDIAITVSAQGLYISHARYGGFIETWENMGLEGNTKQRQLLQWFYEAGAASTPIETTKNIASKLRKALKAAAGIDGNPIEFSQGKATRVFNVVSAGGSGHSEYEEPEDGDTFEAALYETCNSRRLKPYS